MMHRVSLLILEKDAEMLPMIRNANRRRACFAIVALAFSLSVPASCLAQQNHATRDDYRQLEQDISKILDEIENDQTKQVIQARLIGLQYRLDDKQAAEAAWEELLESIADVEGASREETRSLQFIAGVTISSLATMQLGLGNKKLALSALEFLDGSSTSFLGYINLIKTAGNHGQYDLAKSLFDMARADRNVAFMSGRNRGVTIESIYVDVQIKQGDFQGALKTLKLVPSVSFVGMPYVDCELKIASAAHDAGDVEMAESLLGPILENLEKQHDNRHVLNFKLQYVKAHILRAEFHPRELQKRIESCVKVLETHEGVNGPQGAYGELAMQLAKMGHSDEAMKFVEKLEQTEHQQRILQRVAVSQAVNGDMMQATVTIEELESDLIRLEATLEVVKEAIKLGEKAHATEMLSESLSELLSKANGLEQTEENQRFLNLLSSIARLQTRLNVDKTDLEWVQKLGPAEKAKCLLSIFEECLRPVNGQ